MGSARCISHEHSRALNAQMPIVMRASATVGEYSTISPSGVGIKPGTIIPRPFSIHIPTKESMQAVLRQVICRATGGMTRMPAAIASIVMANQIQGTSLCVAVEAEKQVLRRA